MTPDPAPKSAESAAPVFPREQITELAHTLWLEEGKPEGRHLHHWLEAERQLRAGGGAAPPSRSDEKVQSRRTDDIESDKRVDGLGPRDRDPRTPRGEAL